MYNLKTKKMSKITKEMAVVEIQQFVKKFDEQSKEDWQIETDYPQIIKAMEDGCLSFNEDGIPVLKLKYPIKNDEGEVSVDLINFKTRIKPDTLSTITKGLDIGKNQYEYTLRCMSYLIGQPKAMLSKFEKFDYKVIEQVCSVFM